ncbi:hypothetical protein L9F63_019659, partial [Diploptera punctata]
PAWMHPRRPRKEPVDDNQPQIGRTLTSLGDAGMSFVANVDKQRGVSVFFLLKKLFNFLEWEFHNRSY